MKAPSVIVIDFETAAIESRPSYPPEPVGVSIKWPRDKKPRYYAWGHPSENNCDKAEAVRRVNEAWSSDLPLLFHNAKFDVDVAQTHMRCGPLPWERCHDTMFLLFLADPHASSLALKPAAERLLDMPPEERDLVREWLVEHKIVRSNDSRWGAHICKAPGKLVGEYANGDVIRTHRLFELLYCRIYDEDMLDAYQRERQLMPIFLENERVGLNIDVENLEGDVASYTQEMSKVERWLRKRLKAPELNFDCDDDVGAVLDREGLVTEWVLTKTGQRSVSKKNMTRDKFSDPRVFLALGYRNRLKTCMSMFMEPWLAQAAASDGSIFPNWNQVRQMKSGDDTKGTRTGRPSCDDPNLLNVSKSFYDRGDGYEHPKFIANLRELPLVRRYVRPDRGCKWLHRDYNQQELRILAHFEDGEIMAAYKQNPRMDIHTFVQDEIERIAHKTVDRGSTKTMNFGRVYGQGLGSLAEKLNLPVEEVKQIRDAQNRALPGLPELDRSIKELSRTGEPIVTWGGRRYYVEPPKFVEKFGREMTFEYKLLNYLIQGSAADATKEAIIRYHRAKRNGRFLVTVYDEINISAPDKALKQEMKILRECMEGLAFDVPMLSDGKVGTCWGDLVKYKED